MAKSALRQQEGLNDLLVLVEASGLVGQDQIGAHAPAGKVPDAFPRLRAVRMRIEVPHAVPMGVFKLTT